MTAERQPRSRSLRRFREAGGLFVAGRLRTALVGTALVGTGAMVLASCSGGISPKLKQAETTTAPTLPTTTAPTRTTAPKPATGQVALFFTRGGSLGVAHREMPVSSLRYGALKALFVGPNAAEHAAGLSNVIPAGSILEGLSFVGPVAYVDANSQFFASTSASSFLLRLAEVVYTLTDFQGVDSVQFYLHGTTIPNVAGLQTAHALTRADLAAAIDDVLVTSPAPGDDVTSPITISGVSQFNGAMEVQVTDATGKLLLNTINTTTVGETFTYSYPFQTSDYGSATLKVFAASEGSSTSKLVATIPLTLSAPVSAT